MTFGPIARITDSPCGICHSLYQSDQTTVGVRQAGVTPEGFDRWVIPFPIRDGCSIELFPWPPRNPTVVVCYHAGTFRTMFSYEPGQDEHFKKVLSNWQWNPHSAVEDEPINFEEPPLTNRTRQDLAEAIISGSDPVVLWWVNKSFNEAQAAVVKAREYGSAELKYAGHVVASMSNRDVSDAEAMELQIMFYVMGKVGRWVAAAKRGEPVSDDTLLDISTYVTMVQRIRESGDWP